VVCGCYDTSGTSERLPIATRFEAGHGNSPEPAAPSFTPEDGESVVDWLDLLACVKDLFSDDAFKRNDAAASARHAL
jgi:hypothetical protein